MAAQITAFVTIVMDPKRETAVVAALIKMDEVQGLWTVSGGYDLIALVRASNTSVIDSALRTIGNLPGLERTESSIILSTMLDSR